MWILSVSYTHLDVYKRQTTNIYTCQNNISNIIKFYIKHNSIFYYITHRRIQRVVGLTIHRVQSIYLQL